MENITEFCQQDKHIENYKEIKKQDNVFSPNDNSSQAQKEKQTPIYKSESVAQEQQNQSKKSHSIENPNLVEYEFQLNRYKRIEDLIKFFKEEKNFQSSMRRIKFTASLAEEQFQRIDNECKRRFENNDILIQRVNKDQSLCFDFGSSEYVQYIYHIEKIQLKPLEEQINFEIVGNCLIIKNKKMRESDFRTLKAEIQQERDEIKLQKVLVSEIFQKNDDIFSMVKYQQSFFRSKFLEKVKCLLKVIFLQPTENNKRCLDVSFSKKGQFSDTESESESESEGRSVIFTDKSTLLLYGTHEDNLKQAAKLMIQYASIPQNLDFSVIFQLDHSKKSIDEEISKARRELFEKTMSNEFQQDVSQFELDIILGQTTCSTISYRLSGDKSKIQEFQKKWNEKLQMIHYQHLNYQEVSDQFLEKYIKSQMDILKKKICEEEDLHIKLLDSSLVFVYIQNNRNEEKTKKIQQYTESLTNLTKLIRKKLSTEIYNNLKHKFDDFQQYIGDKNKEFCILDNKKKNIYLVGTEAQCDKTLKEIEKYVGNNVEINCVFDFEDHLIKNIFIKYFIEDLKNHHPQYEMDEKINRSIESKLQYKIPSFFQQDVEVYMETQKVIIQDQVLEKVIPCTRHQFEILQNDLHFLRQLQQDLAIELIVDVKKLNELGHQTKLIKINTSDYSKCGVYASNNPCLQVIVIHGNIENISLDALMLNITIETDFIDSYTSPIMQLTGCCRHTIEDINKLQTSKPKISLHEKAKSNKKFSYLQTSLLNTNFPTQKFSMAVLKKDKSNIKELISKFFEQNVDSLNIGLIIPKDEMLQEKYILTIRQILNEIVKENMRQKNVFIFCEKDQWLTTTDLLTRDQQDGILLYHKASQAQLYVENTKEYLLDNKPLPIEFSALLNQFFFGRFRVFDRFYAFLPKKDVFTNKLKIILPKSDQDEARIIYDNQVYSLDGFFEEILFNYYIFYLQENFKKETFYYNMIKKIFQQISNLHHIFSLRDPLNPLFKKNKFSQKKNRKLKSLQYLKQVLLLFSCENDEDKEDIKKAVDKSTQQQLDHIYIYLDQNLNPQQDLVRVSLTTHRIRYMREKIREKRIVDFKVKNIEQDSKKDYIYMIRGYKEKQKDINTAIEKLNNELFRNYDRILWDHMYVNECQPNLISIQYNQNQDHKQIFAKYHKQFRKQSLELVGLQFIQSIPLSQKFYRELSSLHQKWERTPVIKNDMFYINQNINLEEIYNCIELGFDFRMHNDILSPINKYCILLSSKPHIQQDVGFNLYHCLICDVIEGESLIQCLNIQNMKRLPKVPNKNNFYDSLFIENENEIDSEDFLIGIFDHHRIYPSYIATYKKFDKEYETNCTTDDNNSFHKQ